MSDPTQGDHTPDDFDKLVQDVVRETETAQAGGSIAFRHPSIEGYEFLRELHQGGQGIVYEALQRSTKRKVAIKVLVAGRYASNRARRRFEREIELVAQLRHPNIISIFHSGETRDGMQYLVMDYVRGRPLDRYVREKDLSIRDLLSLFATICDGVQYAHHRGVIHRDLKPSNILVDVDGVPRVLDFGLAKLLVNPEGTLLSISEQVIGTLPYMSPEQARGNPDEVDTRTDVYSLGVMLYRLLTGQFPYPVGGPISEAMKHIVDTTPTALSRKWTPQRGVTAGSAAKRGAAACPIDRDVQTIVLTALSKERERRYQTAGELARDIRHWLAGRPIDARRDNRWYVFRKTAKRYKAPVAAGVAFVMLLCVATVAVSILYFRAESARQGEQAQKKLAVEAGQRAEEHLALARRHAYASDMLLAQQAWEVADIRRVRSYLDAHRPDPGQEDLRGFEWYYYWRLCHSEIATARTGDDVRAFDFSSNGEMLAIAAGETVVLRDLTTGREVTLPNHQNSVLSVAFSPSNEWLASASQDGIIHLWDVDRRTKVASSKAGIIFSLEFAPDGNLLAASGLGMDIKTALAGLWSVPDLQPRGTLPGHEGIVYSVPFLADGERLLTGCSGGTVKMWSVDSLQQLREFPAYHRELLTTALSPDGRILATAGYDDGPSCRIKLLDPEAGEKLVTLADSESEVRSLAFSPDGGLLLSGGDDRMAKMWDVNTRELVRTIKGHESSILAVAFSPMAQTFATGGRDDTYKLWDVNVIQEAKAIPVHTKWVNCVVASPAGNLLATAGYDRTIHVWRDLAALKSEVLTGHAYPVTAAAFTPRGNTLITTGAYMPQEWHDGSASVNWQRAAGELKWWDVVRHAEAESVDMAGDAIRDLAMSSDGTTLATIQSKPTNARRIDLWNVASRAKISSIMSENLGSATFRCLAYSSDGSWIAAGRDDGVVSLWSLPEVTEFELPGHMGDVFAVAFDPSGKRLAATSNGGTLAIWSTATRTHTFIRREAQLLPAICFSPDGQSLATAGRDSLVSLRDVHTGQLRASFNVGPMGAGRYEVSSLTFTPDGRRLVAAVGNSILVWEAASSDVTDQP